MSKPRFLQIVFLLGIITVLATGPRGATGAPFDGYNLFTPIGSTSTNLIDNDGDIVHPWSSGYRPGKSVYLMEDSILLRNANTEGTTFTVGEAGGRAERYSRDYAGFDGMDLDALMYPIVDTGQTAFYNASVEISQPSVGQPFYGQDAHYTGNAPNYTLSGDELTVLDNVSGLTWTKSPDWDRDGDIDIDDKFTFSEFQNYPETLNTAHFGGYNDWRTPTTKDLYSLIDFSGIDAGGYTGDPSGQVPFIDTGYFDFGYGDESAGERNIDAQYWSNTEYVSTTMGGDPTVFGVNFADGRIKGYPRDTGSGGTAVNYAYFVRGNTNYGANSFINNGDGTITDQATGLMWQQGDSGMGYNWQQALAYAEDLSLADHHDWRLPNAKELQSIVDYTRSAATHGTAAIDPLFTCSAIADEGGGSDFPFYWSGTTHANWMSTPGTAAAYVAFGSGYGFMERPPGSSNYVLQDVHGAGCQRSDPKDGDPDDYPHGRGPQGDVIRIFNYVRCVRDVDLTPTSTLYVNTDGSCGGKTPCYTSIQAAINAAADGAVINILQGTYTESITLNESKSLTIQGGWDSSFTTQSSNTVINSLTITGTSGTVEIENIALQ